jgi:putative type IC restriction-modification system specificity subunit, partial
MTTTTNNEQKKLNVPNKREQNQSCLDSAEREGLRPNGNVPNLRFPEFRGEWEKVRLGEECNMLCGYAFNGEDIVEQGSYLLMRGINITEGSIRHSSELDRYYSGSIEKLDKYKLAIGDLVIGMDGSKVGRNSAIVSSYEDGSYLVQRVCRIRSSIGNNYILQFINNTKFHQYVDTVKTSSAIPHISLRDIKNYRISIPSTQDETDKIAKLFLLLDERIATQNKIIEDLKKLKSAIIEKHYSQVKKQTTYIADLGEAFSVGSLAKDDLAEIGNPCVIYGELFTTYGEIIFHIESYTNKTDGMILSKKGDLLFPSSTTVDAMSLIAPSVINVDGVVLGGDMFGIHISHNYNAQYLSYYFNHIAKKQLAKFAKGSTIIHLHYTDIEKAKLLLPSLEEQNRMAKCLVALDKKISVEQNLLSLLICQKSYLLQQMFI